MNKIYNKTKNNYSFRVLTILAFTLIFTPFNTASAAPTYVPGHGNYDGSYTFGDFVWPDSNYYPDTSAQTPTVYSNTANPNNTASGTTASKTVVKAKTTNSTNTSVTKTENPADSDLVANAIFGSNSFTPSGLIQWILFAILVLLVVILVRKIYGGSEK